MLRLSQKHATNDILFCSYCIVCVSNGQCNAVITTISTGKAPAQSNKWTMSDKYVDNQTLNDKTDLSFQPKCRHITDSGHIYCV